MLSFFFNIPFAIQKCISVSALSSYFRFSSSNDYFDNKQFGSNKIFLLKTRQFVCAPNLRSVKSDAARTKKIRWVHDHAVISVRIAIDAGNFDASLHHCFHRIP